MWTSFVNRLKTSGVMVLSDLCSIHLMPLLGKCALYFPDSHWRGSHLVSRKSVFDSMTDWHQLGAGWTQGGAAVLLMLQLLGPAFWWWQNRSPDRVGGAISALKAQWLVFVVTLWIVAPLLVIGQTEALLICWLLAGSMLLRGIIELHLCLITHGWKVSYGLAHDALQLVMTLAGLGWLITLGAPTWILFLLVLTASTVVTEIVFVSWFRTATAGPEEAIYFVPGNSEFKKINKRTAWLFLPQFTLFLVALLGALVGKEA